MDAETLLHNHGIMPMTEEEINSAIEDILTTNRVEEFKSLIDGISRPREQKEEQAYWSFAAKTGIYSVFDCLRYDEYVQTWPRVLRLLDGHNKILDVGCGCGLPSIFYAKNLPQSQITSVDICDEALKVAETRAKINDCKNITFKKADMMGILAENEFDLVLASCVIGESNKVKDTYGRYGWQKDLDYCMDSKLDSFRIPLKEDGLLVILINPETYYLEDYADDLKMDALRHSLKETHRETINCEKFGPQQFLLTAYVATN